MCNRSLEGLEDSIKPKPLTGGNNATDENGDTFQITRTGLVLMNQCENSEEGVHYMRKQKLETTDKSPSGDLGV